MISSRKVKPFWLAIDPSTKNDADRHQLPTNKTYKKPGHSVPATINKLNVLDRL